MLIVDAALLSSLVAPSVTIFFVAYEATLRLQRRRKDVPVRQQNKHIYNNKQ